MSRQEVIGTSLASYHAETRPFHQSKAYPSNSDDASLIFLSPVYSCKRHNCSIFISQFRNSSTSIELSNLGIENFNLPSPSSSGCLTTCLAPSNGCSSRRSRLRTPRPPPRPPSNKPGAVLH